jgi:hypothetical protein
MSKLDPAKYEAINEQSMSFTQIKNTLAQLRLFSQLAQFALQSDMDEGWDVTADLMEELGTIEVACGELAIALANIKRLSGDVAHNPKKYVSQNDEEEDEN